MDVVEGLKYAFASFREKKLYPYYFALAAIALMFQLTAPLAGLLLIVPYMLVIFYINGKLTHFKLVQEKLASAPYTLDLFMHYTLTNIVQMLHVLFFWRDKKWLLIYALPLAGFAYLLSTIGTIMASVSGTTGAAMRETLAATLATNISMLVPPLALLAIGAVATMIAWIYHLYRIAFIGPIKLCDPSLDAGLCSQRSWEMTHKKVLKIFLYNLVFGTCIVVLIVAISIISAISAIIFAGSFQFVQSALATLTYGPSAFFLVYLYKGIKDEPEPPSKGAQPSKAHSSAAKAKKRK